MNSIIQPNRNFSELIHKCLTVGSFNCPERGEKCKLNKVKL